MSLVANEHGKFEFEFAYVAEHQSRLQNLLDVRMGTILTDNIFNINFNTRIMTVSFGTEIDYTNFILDVTRLQIPHTMNTEDIEWDGADHLSDIRQIFQLIAETLDDSDVENQEKEPILEVKPQQPLVPPATTFWKQWSPYGIAWCMRYMTFSNFIKGMFRFICWYLVGAGSIALTKILPILPVLWFALIVNLIISVFMLSIPIYMVYWGIRHKTPFYITSPEDEL